MLVLALDTTTRTGSLALMRDGRELAASTGDASRTYAERLLADILALLEGQGLGVPDVDLYAVAAGPGSFTGLRIGIATVQGLAFALGRPIVGVSVLDTLGLIAARQARAVMAPIGGGERPLVGAFMDAQRNEVFGSLFQADSAGDRLEPIDGPVSEPPAPMLARWGVLAGTRPIWLAGDATDRYRTALDGELPGRYRLGPQLPLAPVIAEVALREAQAGRAVSSHAVRPIYVRRPDAELARDRAR